jgi:hypothetical protein
MSRIWHPSWRVGAYAAVAFSVFVAPAHAKMYAGAPDKQNCPREVRRDSEADARDVITQATRLIPRNYPELTRRRIPGPLWRIDAVLRLWEHSIFGAAARRLYVAAARMCGAVTARTSWAIEIFFPQGVVDAPVVAYLTPTRHGWRLWN